MSIATPSTAVRARELTKSQRDAVRLGFGINDYPLQSDRTYIVFDAIAGANNLHIATGAISNYFINKGDGTDELSYNDTGGSKVLTFGNEGRYLITIRGNFNGVFLGSDFTAIPQTERDQYIYINGGSNHPTSIVTSGFEGARKLTHVIFEPKITSIGNRPFVGCLKLNEFDFSELTTVTINSFNTTSITEIDLGNVSAIISGAFINCPQLVKIKIAYNASFAAELGSFNTTYISDLHVTGAADLTQATNMLTALQTGGLQLLANYRLLY